MNFHRLFSLSGSHVVIIMTIGNCEEGGNYFTIILRTYIIVITKHMNLRRQVVIFFPDIAPEVIFNYSFLFLSWCP
jgi:hypothetical protein